jgi:hypothetical protein
MSEKLLQAIAKREAEREGKPKRARKSSKPSSSKPEAQAGQEPKEGQS